MEASDGGFFLRFCYSFQLIYTKLFLLQLKRSRSRSRLEIFLFLSVGLDLWNRRWWFLEHLHLDGLRLRCLSSFFSTKLVLVWANRILNAIWMMSTIYGIIWSLTSSTSCSSSSSSNYLVLSCVFQQISFWVVDFVIESLDFYACECGFN